ncbi:2Fe-2S iron-sulfur cluster-binding protein, partial [Planctomycetota bacterium]
MAKKVNITFNGKQVEVEDGQMVLTALEKVGYEIPHYCFHEFLSVAGSCRLCAVEVGYPDKEGNIKMVPPLVMSCQTPVKEGMVVLSETEKVIEHRKAVLELLLINHPLDCPVCDQAGECNLQDYSFRYGRPVSRFESDQKYSPAKKQISENILLYSTRCILCT